VVASNVACEAQLLAPGIYGVSNDLLDTPWPKVGAGFVFLTDDNVYSNHCLPVTGVPMCGNVCISALL